jgi:hypothetical protein
VHSTYIQLLQDHAVGGTHQILGNQLIANKFALIFVTFLAQDFPHYWQDAFQQLFGLLEATNASDQYKMQMIKFILKVLQTLNSELVERGEAKSAQSLAISN